MYSLCEVADTSTIFPNGCKLVTIIGYSDKDEVVYWRRGREPAYKCAMVDLDKLARTGNVKDAIVEGDTFMASLNDIHIVIDPTKILDETKLCLQNKNFALEMKLLKLNNHVEVCSYLFVHYFHSLSVTARGLLV